MLLKDIQMKSLHTISTSHTASHNLVDSFNLLILEFLIATRLIDNCFGCKNLYIFKYITIILSSTRLKIYVISKIYEIIFSFTFFMISHTFLLIVIFLAPTLHADSNALDDDYKIHFYGECLTWHSRFPPYFFIHSFHNV